MDNVKKPILTDAEMELVIESANTLLIDALTLTNADATLAIGALSLAFATASVLSKIPFEMILDMFTMQYANQALQESARLLQEAEDSLIDVIKPPKTDKGLN